MPVTLNNPLTQSIHTHIDTKGVFHSKDFVIMTLTSEN